MKDVLRMVYGDQKEVELKSQKVELAGAKDLTLAIKNGDKELALAKKTAEKAKSLLTDALTAYRQAAVSYNQADKVYLEIEQQLKSLDVPMPSEITSKRDRSSSLLGEVKDKMSVIQKSRNSI
tara:strand:- start:2765 stop:3133 length:369 start_codon:yes stop_codon:yes gene_type:complete